MSGLGFNPQRDMKVGDQDLESVSKSFKSLKGVKKGRVKSLTPKERFLLGRIMEANVKSGEIIDKKVYNSMRKKLNKPGIRQSVAEVGSAVKKFVLKKLGYSQKTDFREMTDEQLEAEKDAISSKVRNLQENRPASVTKGQAGLEVVVLQADLAKVEGEQSTRVLEKEARELSDKELYAQWKTADAEAQVKEPSPAFNKKVAVLQGELMRRGRGVDARAAREDQGVRQFSAQLAKCVRQGRGLKKLLTSESFKKQSPEFRKDTLKEILSMPGIEKYNKSVVAGVRAAHETVTDELNVRDFKIDNGRLLQEYDDVNAKLHDAAKQQKMPGEEPLDIGQALDEAAAGKLTPKELTPEGLAAQVVALYERLDAVAGEIEKRGSSVQLEADMAVDVSKLDPTELGAVEERLTKAAVNARVTGGEKGPLQGDAVEKLAEVRLAKLSIPRAKFSNAEFAQKQSLFGTDKELMKLSGEAAALGGESGIEGFKVTLASEGVENLQKVAGVLKRGREGALSAGRDVDESSVQQEVEVNVMLLMKRAVAARPETALAIDLDKAGLKELVSAEKVLMSAQKKMYASAQTELAAGRPVEDSQIELLAKIMEQLPQITYAKEWAEVTAQPKRDVKDKPVEREPIDLGEAAKQFQKTKAKTTLRDWRAGGKERAAAREERLEELVNSDSPEVLADLVNKNKRYPKRIGRANVERAEELAGQLLDARVALARRGFRGLPTKLPKAPVKEAASPAREVKAGQPTQTTTQPKRAQRRAARRARRGKEAQ